MKKLQALRQFFPKGHSFYSDVGLTPEFKSFSTKFKSAIKEQIELGGGKLEKFHIGHFDITGFFTSKSGRPYYFATSDVRGNYQEKICFRQCEKIGSFKSHSFNQWCDLEELHQEIKQL